jgi:hypothetical protein
MKMIVEKQMECRSAGETEVLGENVPQRHFCPSQNPTWPDPGLNPGRRGGKTATDRLSYGAACQSRLGKLVSLRPHTSSETVQPGTLLSFILEVSGSNRAGSSSIRGFVGFLSFSSKIEEITLMSHDGFLTYRLQFIIRYSTYYSTQYSVTWRIVKQ